MNPADDWTPRQEALLQEWSVKASGLRWLHTESASFYSLVADLVTIPTIVISTGAGITALKETCGGALTIVVGALNLLAAFIVTLTRYYTPGARRDPARHHPSTGPDPSADTVPAQGTRRATTRPPPRTTRSCSGGSRPS
ncbi:MAG: hypothetical protein EOO66_23355 [Methylobacterium sp.]|nr:MAG: hypothetical protein EOO66_23355 [Methylobacterium sp.]